jgi:hypothetical protein
MLEGSHPVGVDAALPHPSFGAGRLVQGFQPIAKQVSSIVFFGFVALVTPFQDLTLLVLGLVLPLPPPVVLSLPLSAAYPWRRI